jgi:type I restriction enzyme M protein
VLTGENKSKIDKIWDAFWTGGISDSLRVIEQMSFLLFIKRLDDIHTAREKKANRLGKPIEEPIFGQGQDNMRWSRFREFEAGEMFRVVSQEVFPFIKNLHGNADSAYARHMKDAIFMIPTPGLLERVVEQISQVPMEDRDTKGDLYEYMLSKLTTAGRNGQFRTPRHIIKMMVELMQPRPDDIICDPACGTAGFLVAAGEYLREHHSDLFHNEALKRHFNEKLFNGFDFDSTMLRIASMNMMLHGVENPAIEARDSLSNAGGDIADAYTLVLANPPFKGSLDEETVAKDLLRTVKTKKTELLFIRSLVGLDREAATEAFGEFLHNTTYSATQIRFIDKVISYLTQNGTMDPGLLYEPPFTDIHDEGLDGVFGDDRATRIIHLVEEINLRAAV